MHPHKVIMNNISSKLLKIIVAVIKRGTYFEKYQSVNPDILQHPEKTGEHQKKS